MPSGLVSAWRCIWVTLCVCTHTFHFTCSSTGRPKKMLILIQQLDWPVSAGWNHYISVFKLATEKNNDLDASWAGCGQRSTRGSCSTCRIENEWILKELWLDFDIFLKVKKSCQSMSIHHLKRRRLRRKVVEINVSNSTRGGQCPNDRVFFLGRLPIEDNFRFVRIQSCPLTGYFEAC